MKQLDELRRPVSAVAGALGLGTGGSKGFGCPVCGELRRDRRRGAVGVRPDELGWRCHKCKVGGDCFDLVAFALVGARLRELALEDRRRVTAWFGDVRHDAAPLVQLRRPQRPPAREVQRLWRASMPLGSAESAAARFLCARGYDKLASLIDCVGLARLTPPASWDGWPTWWPRGRARLWRLLVRAFDASGRVQSLHARAVEDHAVDHEGHNMPKTLWPRGGFSASGLFFADPAAVAMMRGGATPRRLLICEGLTDWLSVAAWAGEQPEVAVLGGVSGSFPALAQVLVPIRTQVVSLLDADDAGARYLREVRKALPRHDVRRPNLDVM